MFVLNRNTYNVEEYGLTRKIDVTITEFYILEVLASGKWCSYYDIAEWIQKRNKERYITASALSTAISRMRKKGFKIKRKIAVVRCGKTDTYQLEENAWEN